MYSNVLKKRFVNVTKITKLLVDSQTICYSKNNNLAANLDKKQEKILGGRSNVVATMERFCFR
jgi:hypothetical protein